MSGHASQNDPFDNYMDSDGTEVGVGVGFSDTTLLAVSVLGFFLMTMLVYALVFSRVADDAAVSKVGQDGGELLDYEEELLQSDVTSLNRAQRRARAKVLMKRERRVVATEETHDPNDLGENDNGGHHHNQALSRKERQKAAKAAEKKERQMHEEMRQEEQRQAVHEAKEEKKKRLEMEAKRAREEKTQREEHLQKQKVKHFNEWNTFLASPDGRNSLSVQDWVNELDSKGAVVVPLKELTLRYECSMECVKERICKLINGGRINGMIDEETFYHLSHSQLMSLASFVLSREEVSLSDLAEETRRLLLLSQQKEPA